MRPSLDDNLPEVVQPQPFETDGGAPPQVVSHSENAQHTWHGSERDKYPVVYDAAPKYVDDVPPKVPPKVEACEDAPSPQLWSPESLNTSEPPQTPKPERTICGLKRRTFFIVAGIISIILLGAIVGGAVGGTVSKKSSETATAEAQSASRQTTTPSAAATAPSAATSTSPSTSSTASTSQPKPTQLATLNNDTAPHRGLAFQGFSLTSYLGDATPIIQEEGFYDLNITAMSYVWLPDDTNCCLTFCANKTTATGWWCNTRYRPEASGGIPRVYIWCGRNDGVKNVTCS
ncbi:hypothetical protein B0T18DRAFT_417774 [Schizothecium vesticola]|uniref:Uncharacterized protein n=1 Tax=Schizothecium vesticola TaxID=314040 RepID=A0AA40EJ85_9PEZI|nr:hypothetical protein B0T18DRAFT_417774 [Schizothecium vesticola]